jgi:hypothetical protein
LVGSSAKVWKVKAAAGGRMLMVGGVISAAMDKTISTVIGGVSSAEARSARGVVLELVGWMDMAGSEGVTSLETARVDNVAVGRISTVEVVSAGTRGAVSRELDVESVGMMIAGALMGAVENGASEAAMSVGVTSLVGDEEAGFSLHAKHTHLLSAATVSVVSPMHAK